MPRKPRMTATPTEAAEIAAADLSLDGEEENISLDLDFSSLDDDLGDLGSVSGTVSEADVVRVEADTRSPVFVDTASPSPVSSVCDRAFVDEILSAYKDHKNDLDTHLELVLKGIMNVAQTVNESFSVLDNKLSEIDSRLSGLESYFSSHSKEFSSIQKRINEVEEDLSRRFVTMADDVANLLQKAPEPVQQAPVDAATAKVDTAPKETKASKESIAPAAAPEEPVAESSTESAISPAIAHQILTALRSLKRPVQVKSLVSYLAGNLIHRGIDITPEEIERWMYDEGLVDSNGVVNRQVKD